MEESVDRKCRAAAARLVHEAEAVAGDHRLFPGRGWNQIDSVSGDVHSILHLEDGHPRVAAEELTHQGLEVGREVLDYDESEAGVVRQVAEKGLDRFEATGGCSNPDDEGWQRFASRGGRRFLQCRRGPGVRFERVQARRSLRFRRLLPKETLILSPDVRAVGAFGATGFRRGVGTIVSGTVNMAIYG